jgi:protein SSD1
MPIGGGNAFGGGQGPLGQLNLSGNLSGMSMGLDGQSQSIPRGHGRRHSVNVLNKSMGQSISFASDYEGFEDGFMPTGPQQNRPDANWRISESISMTPFVY